MNIDLDSGGALASATLAAHAIEAPGESRDAHAHDQQCANCGAALSGHFCHQCGQRAHVHRSLLHLGEELLHGLLHFDAKAWRTLPLLVIQPGRLTRNYIDGKRTRYVSPLALFLFMVFLMFFVVSSLTYVGGHGDGKGATAEQGTIRQDVSIARGKLAAAEGKLAAARATGQDLAAAEQAVEIARDTVDDAETALAMVASGGDGVSTGMEKAVKKVGEKGTKINTGIPRVDAAARFALANPQFTLYKLKSAASQYSFMLVPISLPFLWLMFFWKRGVTMFDHAVFTLYGLSFMALLVVVAASLGKVGLDAAAGILIFFAPPIHMFLQLRGTYRLRVFSALWRTVVLMFVSVTVLALYLLLILTISLA
jgi:hypothetical protein